MRKLVEVTFWARLAKIAKQYLHKGSPTFIEGRHPVTTERLVRNLGLQIYRLSGSTHLYALSDIEQVEEQAKHKGPLPARATWRKNPKEAGAP